MAKTKEEIIALRAKVGREVLGDPSFDGSAEAYRLLEADKQIAITNAMKAFVRDNPEGFSENQKKLADSPDIQKTEKFGIAEAADSFQKEFVSQGEAIVEKAKPTVNKVLVGVGVGLAVFGIVQVLNLKKLLTVKK